jgi:hypothetical protein
MNKAMHKVAHPPGAFDFRRIALFLCLTGSAFVCGRFTARTASVDPAAASGLVRASSQAPIDEYGEPLNTRQQRAVKAARHTELGPRSTSFSRPPFHRDWCTV